MKKTLALILTVIMVLSIMPVAYAERATYSPEIEEYIEDYIRAYAYCYSKYESVQQQQEVYVMFDEVVRDTAIYPTYNNLADIEVDELATSYECIKNFIDELEKKIADGEFVIVVDFYEYFKSAYPIIIYYRDEVQKELSERAENFNSDKYINWQKELEIYSDELNKMSDFSCDGYIYTQTDFDALMAKIKPLYDLMFACLDGNHPYGEYVSNNDATEEADGTKTATCEFCGATDTITDEGTKLVKDDEPKEEPEEEKVSFFEMIFALIKEFFEKIFSIFK